MYLIYLIYNFIRIQIIIHLLQLYMILEKPALFNNTSKI